MTSLFASRRKPKRIARDDQTAEPDADEETGPVVRRPTAGIPKVKSRLRMSFNPTENDVDDANDLTSENDARTRSSRLNLPSSLQARLNSEREDPVTRPSYNKAYLDELRNSTPTTPKDLSARSTPTDEGDGKPLDIESKFGKSAIGSGGIPTAAEIREKKDRRARLAKEQGADDFIPLEDYDSDGEFKPQRMQVGAYLARDNEQDTRLVRDDEDMAEGFDDFVDDSGRVTLSKSALREQSKRAREQMRGLIEEAEDDSEDAESDAERRQAYEFAQTHHGMEGLSARREQSRQARRPRQPRETTQIPKLSAGLARLKEQIQKIEYEKARIEKRRADVGKEKAEIQASQDYIQRSLEEAGQELERLRAIDGGQEVGTQISQERGLESFGGSPENATIE